MRHTDLERQLQALGFAPLGQRSAKGHMMWLSRFGSVAVPHTTEEDELILNATAEGVLTRARVLVAGEEE